MRILTVVIAATLCCPGIWGQSGTPAAQSGRSLQSVTVADMNKKADPCNDFCEYSNGTWHAANPIPPSMNRWSRRWAAGEQNKEALRVILDEVSARTDWPKGSIEQLIGDNYASCMNEARIDELGIEPARPLLAEIDALKSRAELLEMINRFHDQAIFVPFALTSAQDNHNPTQVIADISASGLGMPDRDYYLKPEERFKDAREKYLTHVAAIFKLAGSSDADAKASSDAVFAVESKLAEASLDNVALRDPQATDHKMTFADLQKLTPALDWSGYFGRAKLSEADLNVSEPKFLQEVDRQLRETPLPTWKIYLKWQLLHSRADQLSRPFAEENFRFYEAYLGGVKEMKPRWKRCAESTDQLLGEALGKKYVEKYFPPEAKARAQEMVDNIILAMRDTLKGLDWMSPETKKKALEKLGTLNRKIGYPDKWKDYSSVNVRRDSYWANVERESEFLISDDRARIGKPVDRSRWGMTPPTSNAYYTPFLNEIVFPAGILQPPAFSTEVVDAVNYGAIGVVIGHEISHGFDDQGAQYDAQGKLDNWWTKEDLERFHKKTQCVADQFDHYFIEPGIHHNGKLVLGESIADLAGAKIAFLAFKKSLEGKPPAPVIDGFTPEQQFFIAWGQFRGDAIRPETQRLMVQGDEHPVAKFRVIGPLSNLAQFQAAFACKAGSVMVRPPADRCEVW